MHTDSHHDLLGALLDELTHAATAFKATGSRTFDVHRPLILETGLASLQARR